MAKCHNEIPNDAILERQRWVMLSRSLPVPSLRGRLASLRTFPDGAERRLTKQLIWLVLLGIRRAICGAPSIFLPALREGRSGSEPLAQQDFLLAGQDKLAPLVVDGGRERHDPGRALGCQRRYFQHG